MFYSTQKRSKSSPKEQGEVLSINIYYLSWGNTIGPAIAGLLVSFSYGSPFWVAEFNAFNSMVSFQSGEQLKTRHF